MSKVPTVEVLALWEEIEGKLFDISFVDYEQKHQVKGVLPQILGNSVVEEQPEQDSHEKVSQ